MIDILTCTYRNHTALEKCINSVREKTKYVDYKHYILCNLPNNDIKRIIHNSLFVEDIRISDNIIPIFNDNNDGSFSSNNNELAAEGNGEYILFCNDDCFPLNDNWLFSMVEIMEKDSNVGVVGALLLYPGEKLIQHCGVFFSNKTNSLPFHMYYKQPTSNTNIMSYILNRDIIRLLLVLVC
jgi:GT2 family glycosyltransferase